MRKYILIIALFCSYSIAAQKINKLDSLRIQTLKEQLVNAKGKTRIDILNNLSGVYENVIDGRDSLHSDSVYKYASMANLEAKQINYEFGLAYSFLRLSKYYTKYLRDSIAGKNYSQQAFVIAEKIKANDILGWYYYDKWELKKAISYFKAANNIKGEADATTWLCYEYSTSGKYDEEGFKYCQRALELANLKREYASGWEIYISQFTFETMSNLLMEVGDYEGALNYLREAAIYTKKTDNNMDWGFGRFFFLRGNFDSSVYYFERALLKDSENRFLVKHTGAANLLVRNYERAVQLLEKALFIMQTPEFAKRNFPANWKGRLYLELAEAYSGLNKNDLAKENYKAALENQRKEYNRITARFEKKIGTYNNAWQLKGITEGLSKNFNALGIYDSAYIYLIKHNKLKDSLQDQNMIWRLNMQLSNYKKAAEDQKRTSQINLLNKDNQLKAQKLKQESSLKNFLIICMILILIAGVFIFRYLTTRRKNEKLLRDQAEQEWKLKQVELQRQAAELEMQALRAQMNPHFIFNCLSSINRFILKNESKTASNYLTRFSRLMRMVLINSQKPLIALDDELEMLGIYLEMERLRFKKSFDYAITFLNAVDSDNVFIPPLLLQPFCENAIWHGLMHLPAGRHSKEGQGRLNIELSMENNILNCVITDNGVGREKAEEMNSKTAEKEKSMGLKITTERLALLNREKGLHTFYEIEDLKDENGNAAGTKVILKISFKESVEILI